MMNEATQQYVRQHADDDVRVLALRGCKDPAVDMTMALQQIQGRQIARQKLPSWSAVDGIVYPPHLNMEQCSSEQTARYKASVARRLLDSISQKPKDAGINSGSRQSEKDCRTTLFDLTGGFGVDFAMMSIAFDEATYVEQDPELFAISSENFHTLGKKVATLCSDGIDVFSHLEHATMIFLDPARRDNHGGRTYAIADCTPNVLAIKDELVEKADVVMLKLSPMLDWRKAVNDLGPNLVSEVHIVSVDGECKELLIVMQRTPDPTPLRLFCVNDDHIWECQQHQPHHPGVRPNLPQDGIPPYLYEPNASVMKAGCFEALEVDFGVIQLAHNSHLFVSDQQINDFPGRRFQISSISSMNKRDLRVHLSNLHQANIAVRNFPLSVVQLRQRLKLNEGGSTYLFATTLANGNHVLIITQRI